MTERPEDSGRISALNMYTVPPTEALSVTEFEEFAFDRLRCAPRSTLPANHCHLPVLTPRCAMPAVLSTIDMARAKGLKGEQLNKKMQQAIRDYMPNTPAGLRKDVYSHFILRLAYCRRWTAPAARCAPHRRVLRACAAHPHCGRVCLPHRLGLPHLIATHPHPLLPLPRLQRGPASLVFAERE